MNDTSPRIHRLMIERMQRKSGEERLAMGASMFDTARRLTLLSLGGSDPIESRRQVFLRWYGDAYDDEQRRKILEQL